MTSADPTAAALRVPQDCPACRNTQVRRIFWGHPLAASLAAVQRGEAVLGGCMVSPGWPDWECAACSHRWFDADDPVRREIEAIVARAFRPPVQAAPAPSRELASTDEIPDTQPSSSRRLQLAARVQLRLVDTNPYVVEAWRRHFASFPEVRIFHDDLLRVARHVAISPANGQGFMDGGIDRAYAAFFGSRLVRRVRDTILRQPEGHLPVGAAVVVPTGHPVIPHLIVAPTMATPEHVSPMNAYRSLRAALRLSGQRAELDGEWFCPGLTTLVGGVAPEDAAKEMAEAYHDWKSAG